MKKWTYRNIKTWLFHYDSIIAKQNLVFTRNMKWQELKRTKTLVHSVQIYKKYFSYVTFYFVIFFVRLHYKIGLRSTYLVIICLPHSSNSKFPQTYSLIMYKEALNWYICTIYMYMHCGNTKVKNAVICELWYRMSEKLAER